MAASKSTDQGIPLGGNNNNNNQGADAERLLRPASPSGEARTDSDGAAALPHFEDVNLGDSRTSVLPLGSETYYLRKVGRLGQGGFGVVVLVELWDGKDWILVALKWVSTELNM
jgi:hypothetical protein